jgi:hypothetical protein
MRTRQKRKLYKESMELITCSLERLPRLQKLRRSQNVNWDTDADCVSSMNQGPCWDSGDILAWEKVPGRAETLATWTLSLQKPSPCHNALKEQAGCHPHTTAVPSSPGLCSTSLTPSVPLLNHTSTLQACLAATHQPARPLPAHQPGGILVMACQRRAPTAQDNSSKPA